MTDAATRTAEISDRALEGHRRWRGKIQTAPKCPVRGYEDFALWYTPGVAAVARAVAADAAESFALTGRGDTVAILSDGSRVLGLGDVGPEAALPVMEGKALLFKYLGGVDAVPLCIARHDADEIVDLARAIAPSFGGINLEDIATPKCFRVLEALQGALPIPVWHDDQQGTAVAAVAGLTGALEVVGKALGEIAPRDFANQVNNALVFPGLFRGVLDVRAAHITEAMALAAVQALVGRARALGLDEARLLPRLDDIESAAEVAEAAAAAAMREGVAKLEAPPGQVRADAAARIAAARAAAARIVPTTPE